MADSMAEPMLATSVPDAKHTVERQRFNSRTQFLFSAVGFAVGIGNVWRFPYVAYDNGGGAFFFPYIIALLVLGVPLVVLELLVGQFFQRSALRTWSRIHWRARGIGLSGVGTTFLVSLYYNIILAWSIVYFFKSMRATPPWGTTAESASDYFDDEILGKTKTINDVGTVQWEIVLALAGTWSFVFASISRGVKGSGKVALVTVTLPYLVLICLLIRGVTLKGAGEGLKFLFTPNWTTLGTIKPWVAAATQILFSTSPCFGILITFGSFLDRKQDLVRDALIICGINSGTSLLAGITVFSTLGYLADVAGVPVDAVAAQGPELAFVVFPAAISNMPSPTFFALLFFVMLFFLGIDSVFSWCETVNDVLHQLVPRFTIAQVAALTCATNFLVGIWFSTGSGVFWLSIFDYYVPSFILFAVGISECIVIGRVYGMDRFLENVEHTTGHKIGKFWSVLWEFILPSVLVLVLIASMYSAAVNPLSKLQPGEILPWGDVVGWLLGLLPISILVVFAFYNPHKKATWGQDPDDMRHHTEIHDAPHDADAEPAKSNKGLFGSSIKLYPATVGSSIKAFFTKKKDTPATTEEF